MRTITIFLISILTIFNLTSQDFTGQWNGLLKVRETQLKVVFHVTKTDDGFSATMDSPDQGVKGIHVAKTTVDNSNIKFEIANPPIKYSGELKGNEIVGTFKQSRTELPLHLSREVVEIESVKRPQEPQKPYPYYSEEVSFRNSEADISLSGTLTLPEQDGCFPVVVLITGSGPQNRDEELFGHKPFLVMADFLTRNDIAVLRFDDRGVGQSEGNFITATSADFATDVESAIAYVKTRKEIDQKKIGLIGHSEGGMIAPMVAAKSEDVNFIVLLAGPGIQGNKLLILQQELITKAMGGISEADLKPHLERNAKLFEIVIQSNDDQKLKTDLTKIISESFANDTSIVLPRGMTKEEFVSIQVDQIVKPWMQYFLKFNPALVLEQVKCPVLALNGEKDLQVPPKENLTAIENALKRGGNNQVTAKELPGLNHLFQACETGLPTEYATIQETFSPIALNEILIWIQAQTK
jgi:uncharacterized protein